jgi:nuclear pore complex protein Nup205
MYLSYVNAKLVLLLQISQTRFGATAVLNAGLFQTIRESGIFSTDPDIGIGMCCSFICERIVLIYPDVPDAGAVKKHYDLLLAFMRVINCCVLSRGSQNEQTLAQAKKFVSENRLWMLTVFKRSARVGAVGDSALDDSVDELAEAYMLIISMSGFLNVSVQP